MDNRFLDSLGHWYLIVVDLLLIIGLFYFLKLPKSEKASSIFWLPFLILTFTFFYENLGSYAKYNSAFNSDVNALIGNIEYPKYNIWVYNLTNAQIAPVLYLLLIKNWLAPSQGKYISRMIIFFLIATLGLQIFGIEPLYFNQPIINSLGSSFIFIGCGLYFIQLISHGKYMESNPLKLISFWQMTIILFTYSLSHIYSVSFQYLYYINPDLTSSLSYINKALGILSLAILVLTLAAPCFPRLFEKEPSFVYFQNSDVV
jgi:hypothetical protein